MPTTAKPMRPECLGPYRMDAPGGPVCSCGRPSRHESGWCGRAPDDETTLAEPDSKEALDALVQKLDDLAYGAPGFTQRTWPIAIELLREFAGKVREHERLTLRERPTRPDLRTLLEEEEEKGTKG